MKPDISLEMIAAGMFSLVILDAFLLYARGKLGHSKLCADDLWEKNWGLSVHRKELSRNCFREIMLCLRFDT